MVNLIKKDPTFGEPSYLNVLGRKTGFVYSRCIGLEGVHACMLRLAKLATAEAKVKYVVVLQVTGTGRGLELDVALQCCR